MNDRLHDTMPDSDKLQASRFPTVRAGAGGVLMGLANLVPGISGGTMILIVGLYDEFISAVAEVTRLQPTRRGLLLLATIGGLAVAAVASLAGPVSRLVAMHPLPMFSLFIGMTLGGVPALLRMIDRLTGAVWVGAAIGFALMVVVAVTKPVPPDKEAIRAAAAAGQYTIQPDPARDVLAGVAAMAAMVLPGISGAYMLLVLGRYEAILAAIALAKDSFINRHADGAMYEFARVLLPVACGALMGIVVVSNLIKWVLRRFPRATLGVLLGILLGSAVGIWPFDAQTNLSGYAVGAAMTAAGFAITLAISNAGKRATIPETARTLHD